MVASILGLALHLPLDMAQDHEDSFLNTVVHLMRRE